MAKTAHSYAKRQREIEKKRKADEKRARKLNKGKAPVEDDAAESVPSAEDGAVADVATGEDDAAAAPASDDRP
jgi:hypothetical protein